MHFRFQSTCVVVFLIRPIPLILIVLLRFFPCYTRGNPGGVQLTMSMEKVNRWRQRLSRRKSALHRSFHCTIVLPHFSQVREHSTPFRNAGPPASHAGGGGHCSEGGGGGYAGQPHASRLAREPRRAGGAPGMRRSRATGLRRQGREQLQAGCVAPDVGFFSNSEWRSSRGMDLRANYAAPVQASPILSTRNGR